MQMLRLLLVIRKQDVCYFRAQDMPERYTLMRDEILAKQGIRWMPYKSHYVFYQVVSHAKKVIVLRVGYNRKNWEIILKR